MPSLLEVAKSNPFSKPIAAAGKEKVQEIIVKLKKLTQLGGERVTVGTHLGLGFTVYHIL